MPAWMNGQPVGELAVKAEKDAADRLAEFEGSSPIQPVDIYIVWSINADSYIGTPFPKSYHQTLEGAIAEIPENIRSLESEYISDTYVKYYSYRAISKVEVGA